MKKFIILSCVILLLFAFIPTATTIVYADDDAEISYRIYDEDGAELTEKQNVEVGDKFIDRNFNEYEIYLVDELESVAKAKFIKTHERPKITKKAAVSPISNKITDKKIALYMTHNDESYVTGDGTESIYGAGGIHDIAKTIAKSLSSNGVNVVLDETVHAPHNSSAYTRSAVTANRLMQENPDAIFDIHRDATSRAYYLTSVNGSPYSKVRIVLGQSNPNKDSNLQFALYMLSVAEVDYPWLFQDIYWGKGHYNQALSNKALLFEMGTHLIEKEYVEKSAKALANVFNATLYNTTVNEEEGRLTLGGNVNEPTVNEHLEQASTESDKKNNWLIIFIPTLIGAAAIGGASIYFYQTSKNPRKTKKRV